MKNIFLLAVEYGVQLKEGDLENLKSFLIQENEFKNSFKIPKDKTPNSGYRKHSTFKVEVLISLCLLHYGKCDLVNEIVDSELLSLEYFLEKAKGYKKKSQIEKVESRIEEVSGLKIDTGFSYTVEDVLKSGMNPKHRNSLLLFSKLLSAKQLKEMSPGLEREYVYIPYFEYIELLEVAKDYFLPQLENAEKLLKKKLK